MATLHSGFSADSFEPVAERFRGFRAFLVDVDGADPRSNPLVQGHVASALRNQYVRGALRGVFKHEWVWGPGVNNAACLRYSGHRTPRTILPHRVPKADCDCGFWAYTNGDHLLHVNGPAVLGIVEGWGRMVIGPDGFRAEKARIVALVFPETPEERAAREAAAEATPLPVKPQATVKFMPMAIVEAMEAFAKSLNDFLEGIAASLARAQGRTPAAPTTVVNRAPVGGAKPEQPKRWDDVPQTVRDAVRALYPDVEVFDTVAEAQRAYPLSDLSRLLEAPEQPEDCTPEASDG